MSVQTLICGQDQSSDFATFVIIVAIIGAIVLLKFVIVNLIACFKLCCRRQQDLIKKYGRRDGSTYAVVTGGSDGLGFELCAQLAAQGFNICLVSRNQVKIDQKLRELSLRFPDVQFRGVQADLSTMTTVAEYRELIRSNMSDIDIGVLCLNAGCFPEGPVDLISDKDFEGVFGLNGLHVVLMTKAFLTTLLSREQRSTIMITSSGLANISMPGIAAYCATKAMVSSFGQALHFELRHKIDFTVWEPGPCYSNILKEGDMPAAITLTAEKAVRGVMRQIGRDRITFGSYFFHLLMLAMPPIGLIGNAAADAGRKKFIDRNLTN